MAKLPFLIRTAVCLISVSVPTITAFSSPLAVASTMNLFSRDSAVCGGLANFTVCGQGLPSEFCCPSSNICNPFNNGASAICCPPGDNCQSIQPIPCDIDALNATAFPQNPVHTTDLGTELQRCGASCCPKGYTCVGNQCTVNSAVSTSTTSSSSSTATSTPKGTTTSPSATSTPTGAAAVTPSQASVSTQCNAFPVLAIIAGFFPGLVSGALLTILIIMCFGRHREGKRDKSDFGNVKATVSDPIYNEAGATRTDFLRHGSSSKKNSSSIRSSSRVRSLFSRPSTSRFRLPDEDPGLNMTTMPRTPENRMSGARREPSMESIKIYSPPDGRFGATSPTGSGRTTFSTMMAHVGLRQDEPYTGYTGRASVVDPRSRALGNGQLR
ncbi:hypothetical protein MMC34_003614 [Xylographa carneopallida]|nr:hypothetical protein [Xylographa carneopallida]